MPSPWNIRIPVLIRSNTWLEPVSTEPLFLPLSIPIGGICVIPGTLRAFIRQETVPRGAGSNLSAMTDVKLIAVMPGVNRALPEFSGNRDVQIQYPLYLELPKYLHCVPQGHQITASWTVSLFFKPFCCLSTSMTFIDVDFSRFAMFLESHTVGAAWKRD
jgi:hypothetical protein